MISQTDIDAMTETPERQEAGPTRIWVSSNRRRQWGPCGGWAILRNPNDEMAGFPDAEYVRADLVEQLIDRAKALVSHRDWGTVNYTDNRMWDDAEALRAALAQMESNDG